MYNVGDHLLQLQQSINFCLPSCFYFLKASEGFSAKFGLGRAFQKLVPTCEVTCGVI
jgi:hypothetical protein